MIYFKFDEDKYKRDFSIKEQAKLINTFKKIQDYCIENFYDFEIKLFSNIYVSSSLVNRDGEVYITRGGHGGNIDKYYLEGSEGSVNYFKYVSTLLIIDNWQEIKEELEEQYSNRVTVESLCRNFQVDVSTSRKKPTVFVLTEVNVGVSDFLDINVVAVCQDKNIARKEFKNAIREYRKNHEFDECSVHSDYDTYFGYCDDEGHEYDLLLTEEEVA